MACLAVIETDPLHSQRGGTLHVRLRPAVAVLGQLRRQLFGTPVRRQPARVQLGLRCPGTSEARTWSPLSPAASIIR